MRLLSFVGPSQSEGGIGAVRTGLVDGEEVVELSGPDVGLPGEMATLLGLGPEALATARAAGRTRAARHELGSLRIAPPVVLPPKVLAIGMNYRAHIAEIGGKTPEHQVWFNKQRTCVVGPGDAIEVPRVSECVDYEGELAFVIGRRARHVDGADAMKVIAGFTVLNDVSVRDWQWRSPTWTMGKSFDTHGPTGPWLVTPDELGDPQGLRLRTWVNGELRQDASTDDMVFSCSDMVEHLSSAFTLEPGDVISTGTPSGVGMGFDPPRWLRAGDSVRIEIEGVGVLENPVAPEADATAPILGDSAASAS
jgi:2-keto-4-pentenoate hydratase/2-oxohepta-3-ene-1,7-dioic acid hydratase in catechol pathway